MLNVHLSFDIQPKKANKSTKAGKKAKEPKAEVRIILKVETSFVLCILLFFWKATLYELEARIAYGMIMKKEFVSYN